MRQVEPSFDNDERTPTDIRIHVDEESHAPKRRKGMPGESKMKKHKPNTPLSTTSSPSVKEIGMSKKRKEFEQCSNTKILPENNQEIHTTTQSTPPNEDEEQSGSPTIQFNVSLGNNVFDLTKDMEEDDDVISTMRGLDREMCLDDGMGISTILDWLLQSMEKSKMIGTQLTEDIDDVLARTDKGKERKKAKMFSNAARDETCV